MSDDSFETLYVLSRYNVLLSLVEMGTVLCLCIKYGRNEGLDVNAALDIPVDHLV